MRSLSRGFTLIELMVVMAILATISGVFFGILRMNQQSWEVARSHMAVSGELRRGMDAMSKELTSTRSTQLNIPADGAWYPGLTFTIPQDVDGDGTILNGAGAVEWSSPISYSLSGTQALRQQAGNTDRILANGVSTLQFRRQAVTPNVVEVQVTVQRATGTGDFSNQATLNTRIRLRN